MIKMRRISVPSYCYRISRVAVAAFAIVFVVIMVITSQLEQYRLVQRDKLVEYTVMGLPPTVTPPVDMSPIPVFYNAYINPENIALSESIVKEQISQLSPRHKLFVRSIGVSSNIYQNATVIRHDEVGDENMTLGLLWEHCVNHPNDTVVYLHNKGSYHSNKENDRLRKFITRGVLSEECSNMPLSCNVCSSRMSPLPHPHVSGNMWVARCNYIKKLINPMKFKEKINKFLDGLNLVVGEPSCHGRGRYAVEHWVFSHPSNNPCDLSSGSFVWSKNGVPKGDFKKVLKLAPRYEKKAYKIPGICVDENESSGDKIEHRLREYDFLYNELPPKTWWGWKFWDPC